VEHVKIFNALLESYRSYLKRTDKGTISHIKLPRISLTNTADTEDAEGNIWRSLFIWGDSNLLSLEHLVYFANKQPDRFGDMVYAHRNLHTLYDYRLPMAASAASQMLLEVFPIANLYSHKGKVFVSCKFYKWLTLLSFWFRFEFSSDL